MVAPNDQLPSRLLDLDGGTVKLICDVEKLRQPQYTTLSHMWGPDSSACPQLTKARLQEFSVAIALADLPTKYREAIRISRALGFRYLWIDSLCIIQDSPEDWEKEALKMATVYGRTACNISYVYPPSDKPNRQHLRDPRVELPCQIFPTKMGDETSGDTLGRRKLVVQDNVGFATRFWAPNTYKDAWPLLSRAWVFQERLLCPRNIYYGQNRLLWECCEGLQDEFCGTLRESPRSKAQFHVVFSGIQQHKDGHVFKTFNGQWHLLIQEYRLLNLTFEKDRTIAFAGVVNAIQSQTKFTYLAGIWKEAAGFDLLWAIFVSSSLTDFRQKRTEMEKKAPTWSWFSVPPGAGFGSSDTIDFNICSQMYARSMWTIYEASIVAFHHPEQSVGPDALLHDFDGLRITLRARKIPCTMEWEDDTLRLLPHGQYVLASSYRFVPRNGMKYVHDDVALSRGSKVPRGTFMILTMLEAWMTLGVSEHRYDMAKLSGDAGLSVSKTHWQYAGLVVVTAGKGQDGRELWKRVGVFIFDDFRDGVEPFVTPFQLNAAEEDIVLV